MIAPKAEDEEGLTDETDWSRAPETDDSFLRAVGKISPRAPVVPERNAGAVVAGRYRLERELGRGGNGVVWAAADTIAHDEVAVKLLSSHARAARVRSEIASLRRLRVPGVVRLLDEGVDGDVEFLVVPLVKGAPFPGRRGRSSWSEIARPTELLLDRLSRVHANGVVHGDLKPANVLVDADGVPWLLDFGLSVISAFEDRSDHVAGTPAYMAPEQARGERADERSDLYAVGVMIYQALAGRLPHEGRDARALLARKTARPTALASIVEGVSAEVATTVDALLSPEVGDRPSSAAETLARLKGAEGEPAPAVALSPSRGSRLDFEEIRDLFGGSDRLTWVRSDAARIIHRQTDGDRERVRALLDDWLESRLCRRDADHKFFVDRGALDEIEAELWSQEISRGPDMVHPLVGSARELAERGRLGHAVALLHDAMVSLRAERPTRHGLAERVLSLWVEIALGSDLPHALDRVLYEIVRTPLATPLHRDLEALVRAALAVGSWTERASELAESVPRFTDPGLELRRLGVRVVAARRSSPAHEQEVVNEVVDEAHRSADGRTIASAAGWLGRLRYREGRYDEAARLQLECARDALWRTERIAAWLNAGSATLEDFRSEEALALATLGLEEATTCRNTFLAGRAEWVSRCARYRLGRDHEVDFELIAAARALGSSDIFGLVAMSEAAHAYRVLDPARGAIAREAHEWWAASGEPIASLLAGSLAVACGENLAGGVRERLCAAAQASDVPGVGIQCAALLHLGGEAAPPPEVRARLACTVPEGRWGMRMDILSVDESVAILERGPAPAR